jgi:hypothetical protein
MPPSAALLNMAIRALPLVIIALLVGAPSAMALPGPVGADEAALSQYGGAPTTPVSGETLAPVGEAVGTPAVAPAAAPAAVAGEVAGVKTSGGSGAAKIVDRAQGSSPSSATTTASSGSSLTSLPFTGSLVAIPLVAGLMLLALGGLLRRGVRTTPRA